MKTTVQEIGKVFSLSDKMAKTISEEIKNEELPFQLILASMHCLVTDLLICNALEKHPKNPQSDRNKILLRMFTDNMNDFSEYTTKSYTNVVRVLKKEKVII